MQVLADKLYNEVYHFSRSTNFLPQSGSHCNGLASTRRWLGNGYVGRCTPWISPCVCTYVCPCLFLSLLVKQACCHDYCMVMIVYNLTMFSCSFIHSNLGAVTLSQGTGNIVTAHTPGIVVAMLIVVMTRECNSLQCNGKN